MRRIVHGVLVAMLIIGNVAAKTYTDKTFLMPRSHGMNMAMEYTTWHKHMALIDDKKFGGTLQATGFYEKSNNKKDLGQYFGTCNHGNSNKIEDFFVVAPHTGGTFGTQPVHMFGTFMFHSHLVSANGSQDVNDKQATLADKLCWRPYRESYGLRLDYHQKLDKLVDGLFFKVTVPIVHVKTSMGWTSSCCKPCSDTTTNCNTDQTCKSNSYCTKQALENNAGALAGTEYSVADYLTGCVSNDASENKQVALCKAKIHNGNNETGIADIDVILGYNFLYKPTKHFNINAGLTIPTGNTPDGEFLWEAVVGNAGHWALGFGVDSAFQIWKDTDKSLDFIFAFNYRYLFSSTEKRTMGFKFPSDAPSDAGKRALYGHWMLGGKKGASELTPLANFLTLDQKITPGSHFDGIIQLAFNYENWTFDGGYNLFAKSGENVKRKCNPCTTDTSCDDSCNPCTKWEDDTYAAAYPDWEIGKADTVKFGDDTDQNSDDTSTYGGYIQGTDLCTDACTQDSVLTHKLYGGIGYSFFEWEYPLMLGVGGSYEWVTDNNALECWSLWAKIGLTF